MDAAGHVNKFLDDGLPAVSTLIVAAVSVAARVEQLTKTRGDAILLTDETFDGLASRPKGLVGRGVQALKGKSAAVQVLGSIDGWTQMRVDLGQGLGGPGRSVMPVEVRLQRVDSEQVALKRESRLGTVPT